MGIAVLGQTTVSSRAGYHHVVVHEMELACQVEDVAGDPARVGQVIRIY